MDNAFIMNIGKRQKQNEIGLKWDLTYGNEIIYYQY